MMPQLIAGASRAAALDRARDLLTRMGLEPRLEHRPSELSGGEQQRVAIARALANRPLLLLADEPTGNLDPETAARVHDELLRLIADEGLGALVATHNLELAEGMSRIARLERGNDRLLDRPRNVPALALWLVTAESPNLVTCRSAKTGPSRSDRARPSRR